jgi:hypothetical protein
MPSEPLDAPENLPKERPGQVTLGKLEHEGRPSFSPFCHRRVAVTLFETVTVTDVEPVLPAESTARALMICWPFGTFVESHAIDTGPRLLVLEVLAASCPLITRLYVLDTLVVPSSHSTTHAVLLTVVAEARPLLVIAALRDRAQVVGAGDHGHSPRLRDQSLRRSTNTLSARRDSPTLDLSGGPGRLAARRGLLPYRNGLDGARLDIVLSFRSSGGGPPGSRLTVELHLPGRGDEPARRRRRASDVLRLPQGAVENVTNHEHD